MAVTKITNIRNSVQNSINYIINPEKTDGGFYVSSYACGIYTADLEFAHTAMLGTRNGTGKAEHLMQSFVKNEVDAATAHKIGREFALELTDSSHEFVIATHVDKEHIHNHIVFNTVSFTDHRKFERPNSLIRKMCRISDEICASYGLSVIENPRKRAKPYFIYMGLAPYHSKRQQLKDTIDLLIPLCSNADELMNRLEDEGYAVKKEKTGYSFKKDDSARAIRIKSLGERYSYDQIQKRINENKKEDTIAVTDDNLLVYLDNILKDEMYLSGNGSDPAIRRKQIMDTYAFLKDRSIFSLSMLNKSQTDLAVAIKDKHARLHAMEVQIDELENICENLNKRDMYNDIYASYIKHQKSSAYKEAHITQITIFESCCRKLAKMNVDPSTRYTDCVKKLNELIHQKETYYDSYKNDLSDLKKFDVISKRIDRLIKNTNMDIAHTPKPRIDHDIESI